MIRGGARATAVTAAAAVASRYTFRFPAGNGSLLLLFFFSAPLVLLPLLLSPVLSSPVRFIRMEKRILIGYTRANPGFFRRSASLACRTPASPVVCTFNDGNGCA